MFFVSSHALSCCLCASDALLLLPHIEFSNLTALLMQLHTSLHPSQTPCSLSVSFSALLPVCCRYVFCCSSAHNVAPTGKYIAFVSTNVETANPEAELAPGLALLGPIDEKFIEVKDVYEPVEDGTRCVVTCAR